MNQPVQNKNGKLIAKISLAFFIVANTIWLFIPFMMAGLWSLVDPEQPWSYPDILIDASRDLGASKLTTFKDVYLPMLKPSFLAAIIFCLVKSIEEFSIAFVIGSPDFITVPTILYSFLGYSFIRPNAAVVSIILLVPNIILMMIIEKLLKGNYLSQSTGKA